MKSLNKLKLICDEHYFIKDIRIFKIDGAYSCFIEHDNCVKQLNIDCNFNELSTYSNAIIIFRNNKYNKYCLIDTYTYNIIYCDAGKDFEDTIANYIDTHLSKEFILDLCSLNTDSSKDINVTIDEKKYHTQIQIRFNRTHNTIEAICNNKFDTWAVKASEGTEFIIVINSYISLAYKNDECYIVYKGIRSNNKYARYLRNINLGDKILVIFESFDTDIESKIVEFTRDGYKDILTYKGKLVDTCNSSIVLKPVYKDNYTINHYELINLEKQVIFGYPVTRQDILGVRPGISGISGFIDLFYYKQNNDTIAFLITHKKLIILGNVNDLTVIGKSLIKSIIINNKTKKVCYSLFNHIYICNLDYADVINIINSGNIDVIFNTSNRSVC